MREKYTRKPIGRHFQLHCALAKHWLATHSIHYFPGDKQNCSVSARALNQNYIQGSSFQSHNYADVGCKDAQNATRRSWKEQIMILLKLETLSASVAA
jgi:hypothetical protein